MTANAMVPRLRPQATLAATAIATAMEAAAVAVAGVEGAARHGSAANNRQRTKRCVCAPTRESLWGNLLTPCCFGGFVLQMASSSASHPRAASASETRRTRRANGRARRARRARRRKGERRRRRRSTRRKEPVRQGQSSCPRCVQQQQCFSPLRKATLWLTYYNMDAVTVPQGQVRQFVRLLLFILLLLLL